MDVAVNKAGQDELATEIRDLALIICKASFVAHISKFSVFHYN